MIFHSENITGLNVSVYFRVMTGNFLHLVIILKKSVNYLGDARDTTCFVSCTTYLLLVSDLGNRKTRNHWLIKYGPLGAFTFQKYNVLYLGISFPQPLRPQNACLYDRVIKGRWRYGVSIPFISHLLHRSVSWGTRYCCPAIIYYVYTCLHNLNTKCVGITRSGLVRRGPLTRYVILRVCIRRECRERFPHHQLQRKPLVYDPGMHHGTCVTHVPWCMSGSLTRGGGKNVPGTPGACATRNFTYLVRGPCMSRRTFYHCFRNGLSLFHMKLLPKPMLIYCYLNVRKFMKMYLNISPKWRPFCPVPNVLTACLLLKNVSHICIVTSVAIIWAICGLHLGPFYVLTYRIMRR